MSSKQFYLCLILLFMTFSRLSLSLAEEQFNKPILIEKSPVPELPRYLAKSSAKGIALVKVTVDARGNTLEIVPVRSTGLKPLDSFLISWIQEWKFLPKLKDEKTVSGFTVISIRYDLSASQFITPPIYELTLTLPDAYQRLWSDDETDETNPEKTFGQNYIQPLSTPDFSMIPQHIQALDLVIGTTVQLVVDEKGQVTDLSKPTYLDNEDAWEWIQGELKKTVWPSAQGTTARYLELPMVLDCSKCKIEFGSAKIITAGYQ